MPIAKLRICAGCGCEFKGTKANRGRYCSDACNPGSIIKPRVHDAATDQVISLWKSGDPIGKIGRIVGVSTRTVSRWVDDLCKRGILQPRNPTYQSRTAAKMPRRKVADNRRCLSCSSVFASDGLHNRICEPCREGSAWKSGCSYWFAV